jgi:hypothetical protein
LQQKCICLKSEHLHQISATPSTGQLNTHKFVAAIKPKAKKVNKKKRLKVKSVPVTGREGP